MQVIRAAVLIEDEMTAKQLSTLLDFAFEAVPQVIQFTVEGHGVDDISNWDISNWLEGQRQHKAPA